MTNMTNTYDVYVGTELKSGPWFIKKMGDGEIVIPRTNPKYVELLTELTECQALETYKKIFEELELAKQTSEKYLEAVAKFESEKGNA
jgi:hypothetical protein